MIDLAELYDHKEWVVAYAYTEFECESGGTAELWVGSDDGIKIWVNGRLVHSIDAARSLLLGEDKVHVLLLKGRNRLLIKSANRTLGWGFSVRVCDAEGNPIPGLRPARDLGKQ